MTTRFLRHSTIAVTALAVSATACSRLDPSDAPNAGDVVASLTLGLRGGGFAQSSVRICGSRPAPDPKYRCAHELSPPGAGVEGCPCFDFDDTGHPIDGSTNAPATLDGLCAWNAAPAASWTFEYFVYDGPRCGGTRLNDGGHNFACYDVEDLGRRASPNESTLALAPGTNTNHVLCSTDAAREVFAFESCTAQPPAKGDAPRSLRIACGCTLGAGHCTCGEDGVTEGDLEEGCVFDPTNCQIVCTPVAP